MTKDASSSIPALEPSFRSAYERAIYRVFADSIIELRIGIASPEAAVLLRTHGVARAALVTAWNPFSQLLASAENSRRNDALRDWLHVRQLPFLPSDGLDEAGEWEPEQGFFAMGASVSLVDEMLERFEQHAVVAVAADGTPRLVFHPRHCFGLEGSKAAHTQ